MRKSYGGYGPTIRTSRRKKNNFAGSIAMVLACVLVFAAGLIVGKLPQLTQNNNGDVSSQQRPADSSSNTSSTENTIDYSQLPLVEPEDKSEVLNAVTPIPLEQIDCKAYVVIDRMTGEVLLEKNKDEKTYPGSTTKILTAALAMEMVQDPKTQMTVTSRALSILSADATKMGLVRDEALSFEDLLYGMMLPSACDAANVIAENAAGGKYNDFVVAMNAKAKEIGCSGTYFVNPSGIYANSHFSTVADLARIETFAEKNSWYRQIVGTQQYSISATNVHTNDGWNIIENSNQLLENESLFASTGNIIEVNGSKTGTTVQGGYSMVCSAVTKDGVELVAVISGINYNNGNGRYQRIPYMISVLEEGAKAAAAKQKKTIVATGLLDTSIDAGASALLPEGMQMVTKRGLSVILPGTETSALTNGDTPIFYDASGEFTVKASYYNDIKERLDVKKTGEQVEVGYLTITAPDGSTPVNQIPIYATSK